MCILQNKGGRYFAALLLSIALLQIAGYWFAGAMVNGDGPLAIPQPDTLLYLQAARRVAEGHAFSFSAGSAPCTGTTSVLHPFVLAPMYLLGVNGESFVTAGFLLNAFFYLLFVFCWGKVVWERFDSSLLRWCAGVMVPLFGQTAYATFSQSDIGLWLAVSALMALGLFTGRKKLFAAMLLIGPWIRPEGMVCVAAYGFVLFIHFLWSRFFSDRNAADENGESASFSRFDWVLLVFAVLSVLGVFALNILISGKAQFSSVANKGYFTQWPFFLAFYFSACDFVSIVRSQLFGMATSSPRHFYFLPVIGCVLLWSGIYAHAWTKRSVWHGLVYLLAMVGGLWTVAVSGWQNTNVDRYLAWIMPLLVIFSAEGAVWIYGKAKNRAAGILVIVLPVFFSCGATASFWTLFHSASAESDLLMKFGVELKRQLPPDAVVGSMGNNWIAYPLGNHKIVALNGIYSPQFSSRTPTENLELLKYEPSERFDFWIFEDGDRIADGFMDLQNAKLLDGPGGIVVRKANWSAFDCAAAVPEQAGMNLKWRIDVCHKEDEQKSGYEIATRYDMMAPEPCQRVDELAGEKIFDCGRIVYGYDSMFVPLDPGKNCKLVMRTVREQSAEMHTYLGPKTTRKFEFVSPLRLNVSVDGEAIGEASVEISDKGFSDVVIDIPGSAIKTVPTRISLLGDHIAFAYWFYQ